MTSRLSLLNRASMNHAAIKENTITIQETEKNGNEIYLKEDEFFRCIIYEHDFVTKKRTDRVAGKSRFKSRPRTTMLERTAGSQKVIR